MPFIFKNTQFLKLWGNQVLLQIAFNMCNFSALLIIENITGSRFALSQFYAAITLPAFFVGIFSGAIVDISNRKKLMLITDACLSILFLFYALFASSNFMILVIAFLSASVAQFFTPAEAATIPQIVKKEELNQANSLFLFTALGSVMIGYALAGPIIQASGGLGTDGEKVPFVIAGIVTAFGFFLRLSLKTIETKKPLLEKARIISKTLSLTFEILGKAVKDHYIFVPLALLTLVEFSTGILSVVILDFIKRYLLMPTTSASYFLVLPLVLGAGLGVYILDKISKKVLKKHILFLSATISSILISLLGFSALYLNVNLLRAVTFIFSLIVGLVIVMIAVLSRTILQEKTEEEMLGRVFSLVAISSSAVTPLPILFIGLVTDKIETSFVLIYLGVFLFLLTFFGKIFVEKKFLKQNQ